MRQVTRGGFALSVALSGVAGYVDAIGFIDTGGLFVSFMSGNSTQAGVLAFEEGAGAAVLPLLLVAAFVVGVTVAAVAGGYGRRRTLPVLVSTVSLALSVVLIFAGAAGTWWFLALAFAMGGLNTLYLTEGRARVAITYATGTLVSLGLGLAALFSGRSRTAWVRPFLLWGSLAGGAVVGALAHRLGSGTALLLATVGLAVVTVILAVRTGSPRDGR